MREPEMVPLRNWVNRAACKDQPLDSFFPTRGKAIVAYAKVKQFCDRCPVVNECLEFAIKSDEHGFWGGTTEEEREQIRRARSRAVAS